MIDDPEMAWQVVEQQAMISCYLTALERQGQILARQSHYAEALEPFGCLVARDCYREDIHSALMMCYYRLGRRSEAFAQYRCCQATLSSDLGIEPLAETTALYHTILVDEHS